MRGWGCWQGLEWILSIALRGEKVELELTPDLQGVLGVNLRWQEVMRPPKP